MFHPEAVRVGIGYDVHRIAADRPFVLGGVRVPADFGLQGHSDADVLAHAVMDALLGAARLGDIGRLYPDTDPRYKDVSSLRLMEDVRRRLEAAGWRVGNVDAIVAAERPKLAPHAAAMEARMAEALNVAPERVSVKATTSEGLGFVGEGRGVAAHAVALIYRGNGDR